MKVALITFGCAYNRADSAYIKSIIGETVSVERADIVIINSCGVKQATENKILSLIEKLLEQNKKIVLTGCLPFISSKVFRYPVSFVGPDSLDRIKEAVEMEYAGEHGVFLEKGVSRRYCKLSFPGLTAILPISQGCLGSCSYCGVKAARGNLISYPPNELKVVFDQFVEQGKKEILITSQDNAVYGKDIGTNIVQLLNLFLEKEGEYFVRIGMMNPRYLRGLEKGLAKLLLHEKLYNFLHIPIQSGSDDVLEHMRRGYSIEEALKVIGKIRNEETNFVTDIIVGYPTETEDDFKETMEIIDYLEPDMVNVSKFSPRESAPLKMKPLPSSIVAARSRAISELVREIGRRRAKRFDGKTMRALCFGNYYRLENYKYARGIGKKGWIGKVKVGYDRALVVKGF